MIMVISTHDNGLMIFHGCLVGAVCFMAILRVHIYLLFIAVASAAGTGGRGGGSPPEIVTYTIPTLHSLRHQPYQSLPF